jgi:hypothetical protein
MSSASIGWKLAQTMSISAMHGLRSCIDEDGTETDRIERCRIFISGNEYRNPRNNMKIGIIRSRCGLNTVHIYTKACCLSEPRDILNPGKIKQHKKPTDLIHNSSAAAQYFGE